MRPTWTEVSLKTFGENFSGFRRLVGPRVAVCAILKGDASGHGAIECAKAPEGAGAMWFAVTNTEEGVRLRDARVAGRILLLTGYWRGEEEDVVRNRLTPAIWEPWQVNALADAVRRVGVGPLPVHVKVDTGLTRLGTSPELMPALLQSLTQNPVLVLEGLFTHLASAEALDSTYCEEQSRVFDTMRELAIAAGFTPTYLHIGDSATALARPALWRHMIRPGIALFGFRPRFVLRLGESTVAPLALHPVLSCKTRVISLRNVGVNSRIGYNGTYVTSTAARLAVLPVGFGDGLRRGLSSHGRVIIRDPFAPIVGTITMDLTVVDVSHVRNVSLNEEVLLIGRSEHCELTAWEHADLLNTVPDEILCGISRRVPRHYVSWRECISRMRAQRQR